MTAPLTLSSAPRELERARDLLAEVRRTAELGGSQVDGLRATSRSHPEREVRAAAAGVAARLETGSRLSDALAARIPTELVEVVRAGEEAGRVPLALAAAEETAERLLSSAVSLRDACRAASWSVATAVAVLTLLVMGPLPVLWQLRGQSLPLPFAPLLQGGGARWAAAWVVAALAIFALGVAWKQSAGALLGLVPGARGVHLEASRALACRSLAQLLAAGRSTPESLRLAAAVLPRADREAWETASLHVADGQDVALALEGVRGSGALLAAGFAAASGSARAAESVARIADVHEWEATRLADEARVAAELLALLAAGLITGLVAVLAWGTYFGTVGHFAW